MKSSDVTPSLPLSTGEEFASSLFSKCSLDKFQAQLDQPDYTKTDETIRLGITHEVIKLANIPDLSERCYSFLLKQLAIELCIYPSSPKTINTIYDKLEQIVSCQQQLVTLIENHHNWIYDREVDNFIISKKIKFAEILINKPSTPEDGKETKDDKINKLKSLQFSREVVKRITDRLTRGRTDHIEKTVDNLINLSGNLSEKEEKEISELLFTLFDEYLGRFHDGNYPIDKTLERITAFFIKDDDYTKKLLSQFENAILRSHTHYQKLLIYIIFILKGTLTSSVQFEAYKSLVIIYKGANHAMAIHYKALFQEEYATTLAIQYAKTLDVSSAYKYRVIESLKELLRFKENIASAEINVLDEMILSAFNKLTDYIDSSFEKETDLIGILNRWKNAIPLEAIDQLISKLNEKFQYEEFFLNFAADYYREKLKTVQAASAQAISYDGKVKEFVAQKQLDEHELKKISENSDHSITFGEMIVNFIKKHFNSYPIPVNSDRFIRIKNSLVETIYKKLGTAIYPDLDLVMLASVEDSNANAIEMQKQLIISLIDYTQKEFRYYYDSPWSYDKVFDDKYNYTIRIRLLLDFFIQLQSFIQSPFNEIVSKHKVDEIIIKLKVYLDFHLKLFFSGSFIRQYSSNNYSYERSVTSVTLDDKIIGMPAILNSTNALAKLVTMHVPSYRITDIKTNKPFALVLCAMLLIPTNYIPIKDIRKKQYETHEEREKLKVINLSGALNIDAAKKTAESYLSRKSVKQNSCLVLATLLLNIIKEARESKELHSNSLNYLWNKLHQRGVKPQDKEIFLQGLRELVKHQMPAENDFQRFLKVLDHQAIATSMPSFSTLKPIVSAPEKEEKKSVVEQSIAASLQTPSPTDGVNDKPLQVVVTSASAPEKQEEEIKEDVSKMSEPFKANPESEPSLESKAEASAPVEVVPSIATKVVAHPEELKRRPSFDKVLDSIYDDVTQSHEGPQIEGEIRQLQPQPLTKEEFLEEEPGSLSIETKHEPASISQTTSLEGVPSQICAYPLSTTGHLEKCLLVTNAFNQLQICTYTGKTNALKADIKITQNEPGYLSFLTDVSADFATPLSFKISLFGNNYALNGKTPLHFSSSLYFDVTEPIVMPDSKSESTHISLTITKHSEKLVATTTEIIADKKTSIHINLSIFNKQQEISTNGSVSLPTLIIPSGLIR